MAASQSATAWLAQRQASARNPAAAASQKAVAWLASRQASARSPSPEVEPGGTAAHVERADSLAFQHAWLSEKVQQREQTAAEDNSTL